MKIKYMPHAESQLAERSIDKQIIEDIIKNPQQLLGSTKGRKIAQSIILEGSIKFLIRIVYIVESHEIIVLTAYRTTKIQKYWVEK